MAASRFSCWWRQAREHQARIDGSARSASDALAITGEKWRPPAPIRLAAATAGNGDLALSWVRRSRTGWAWADDMDAPLGEARELYRVTVTGSTASVTVECEAAGLVIGAAEIAPVGSGPATVEVRQIGDRAVSRAATLSFTLT